MAILRYSLDYIEKSINQITGNIIIYLKGKNILESINLFFLILFFCSFSLIGNNYLSYKFVYFFQFFIILFFILQNNKFKISKKILVVNCLLLFFLFYEINRYFYYVLFLSFFTTFFQLKNFSLQIRKKYNGILLSFILVIIFLILAKTNYTSPDSEIKQISILYEILKNFKEYRSCINVSCDLKFIEYRYGIFSLPQNFSGIFLSIFFYFFLKDYKKSTFFLLFTFFNFFIFYLTWSKSMLLFYSFVMIQSFLKLSIKNMILIFFILNLLKIISSVALVNNFENPWKQKDRRSMQKIYEEDFCDKIENVKILMHTSNCGGNNLKLNFFGYSSFYKFYSYGLLSKKIIQNYSDFILPNPEWRLIKKQIISQFEAKNDFSIHSMLLMCFFKLGFVITGLFFFNLIYFSSKINEHNIFYSFLFSSTFLSLDLYLIFPLIIISQYNLIPKSFK
jgi:hypothetical protein